MPLFLATSHFVQPEKFTTEYISQNMTIGGYTYKDIVLLYINTILILY